MPGHFQVLRGRCGAALPWAVLGVPLCCLSRRGSVSAEVRPSWRENLENGVRHGQASMSRETTGSSTPASRSHPSATSMSLAMRLRLAGGYGQYEIIRQSQHNPIPNIVSFSAATYYGDALVGYLERLDRSRESVRRRVLNRHDISPFDPENQVYGDEIGIKGALELWLDIGEIGFASLDMSWSSAYDTRNVRSRLGARITPSLSGGVEGWLNLDDQSDCDLGWDDSAGCLTDDQTECSTTRGPDSFSGINGKAANTHYSGGVSGGSFQSAGDADPEPYATLNWMTQILGARDPIHLVPHRRNRPPSIPACCDSS